MEAFRVSGEWSERVWYPPIVEPEKIVYGTSLPYWVGLQGLTTREVGLGAIDTEGGGRLRAQRVSEACLVPVRKGRGLEGEKKETEVGVKVARPLVPIRALTDHRLWAKS